MVKKHFTLRLTVVSFLTFLSLFLASFSCQDHEVPEVPEQPALAKINTLDISGNVSNGFNHSVQFTDLGAVPIVEYGMMTFAGKPGDVKVPNIEAQDPLTDRKYAFVGPGYMPPSLDAKTVTRAYDGPNGNPVRLFYRAYAILLNNTVIYGQVKFVDFVKNPSNVANPVIKTLDASKGDDSDFIAYSLQFENLGNVPVNEYGIVTYQGNPNEQQTPEVPTDNPLEKKYPYAEAVNLDVKNIIKQYDGPIGDPIRLFYRAYAILNNGEVVYGEVKFLDFDLFEQAIVITGGTSNNLALNSIVFQLNIASLGNNPVVEYGIVYKSFNNNISESYVPTVADEKAIFGGTAALGVISQTFQFVGPNIEKVNYRAYVIHANGKVVYGDRLKNYGS